MKANNPVAWLEGLFLQPQHFQQQQRYIDNLIHKKQQVRSHNEWGFLTLVLNLDLLSIGKITLSSCSGIFPDGTYFDMPGADNLPAPYDIEEGWHDTRLYLALPRRKPGVPEMGEPASHTLCRYHVLETAVSDSTAGSDQTSEIQVGSLACRLMSDKDDLSHYTCLPITVIAQSRANHDVSLDKHFVPTCLDVHQVPSLKQIIQEIQGLLTHRATMLAGRLTDTQTAGSAEIIDFMLLQLVNKYEPLLHYLSHKIPLHPEHLFAVLIQLMGEMATFTSDQRRPIQTPVYRHAQLYDSYQPVIKALRQALSAVLEQNATAIALSPKSHGMWVGQIHDKTLIDNAQFVLAVYADLPQDEVRTRFGSQVKIAPVERIRLLVSRALPAIPLTAIAVAPRQIPYHANYVYFSLNTQHELWAQMKVAGGIAFHVGSQWPGLKLALWAIRG
jgi:type VI secretion system protein ImpJ